MAYDRYQIADPVTVGEIHAKKGILVLGGELAAYHSIELEAVAKLLVL